MKMSDRGADSRPPSPVAPSLKLDGHEKEIIKRQIDTPKSQMSRLWLLYSCTTTYELFVLVISSIAATIGGALQPISFVSYSLQGFSRPA